MNKRRIALTRQTLRTLSHDLAMAQGGGRATVAITTITTVFSQIQTKCPGCVHEAAPVVTTAISIYVSC